MSSRLPSTMFETYFVRHTHGFLHTFLFKIQVWAILIISSPASTHEHVTLTRERYICQLIAVDVCLTRIIDSCLLLSYSSMARQQLFVSVLFVVSFCGSLQKRSPSRHRMWIQMTGSLRGSSLKSTVLSQCGRRGQCCVHVSKPMIPSLIGRPWKFGDVSSPPDNVIAHELLNSK